MLTFLQSMEVLRGVHPSTLQGIAAAVTEVRLAADTYLFRQGEVADALFIIRAGSVRVLRQLPHGGAVVVMHLGAGAVVGERGVLDGASRVASVMTDTPGVFLKLHRAAWQALAAADSLLRAQLQRLASTPSRTLAPEGDEGIRRLGHRDYIGGMWEEIGRLQFNFLRQQGLTPSHCLLDIGCGALRGGVHFITYLEPGHYLGLDKEKTLILQEAALCTRPLPLHAFDP
jgi:hypothetical protein